jgi:hypothetical protein
LYESLIRDTEAKRLRELTVERKYQMYCGLFALIFNARRELRDWSELERWQWKQKLSARLKAVHAWQELDRIRHERSIEGSTL